MAAKNSSIIRHKSSQKLARNRTKSCQKLAKIWPKIAQKLAQKREGRSVFLGFFRAIPCILRRENEAKTRPKPGQKYQKTRPKLSQKGAKNQPKADPEAEEKPGTKRSPMSPSADSWREEERRGPRSWCLAFKLLSIRWAKRSPTGASKVWRF